MPFNNSGVFLRLRNWVADAAANIKIRADLHDDEDNGFATGLSNCICRDGQSTISADIPWSGKKIVNLGNPLSAQDAATKASSEAAAKTYTDSRASPFKRTVISTTGSSTTFQYDATTLFADIEVIGGGGGGASTNGSSGVGLATSASGGGAGAKSQKFIAVDATVRANTKTIVVGSGGVNATGGTSSYNDGVNSLSAGGGVVGNGGATSANTFCRNGGPGGTASGGDINIAGGPGQTTFSQGMTVIGTNSCVAQGGNGANGPLGGGGGLGQCVSTTSAAAFVNGGAGTAFGAGGGGGYMVNSATQNALGGAGYQGCVIITEYR